MKTKMLLWVLITGLSCINNVFAQTFMANIPGRKVTSLNGKWNIIIDAFDAGAGDWMAIYKDRKPKNKTEFVEYSYDEGPTLNVPGDFNSQKTELFYYESTVWYKRTFSCDRKNGKRIFIHFGAVNYKADIFINNKKVGSHEGGFTPFQFEITDFVKDSINSVIVRTNNQRIKDGIPGLGFDWFNYGGITRDVSLIETPSSFIEDYFIQLEKGSLNKVKGRVKINGAGKSKQINVQIPEAKVNFKTMSNTEGIAEVQFSAPFKLWSPDQPKLYKVIISTDSDTIAEEIGFRSIEVKGTDILLNGKPLFLKGVNIHEEIPQRLSRASSPSDAGVLLGWAKELGCNFVRLAHYPHNEHIVRLADKLGLMVWEEIPVYQHIDFADQKMQDKMNRMLREMVERDKNRCSAIIWSMSNETYPSKERNEAITNLVGLCRSLDPTRLISSAFVNVQYQGNTATITDSLNKIMDVISINEYFGWYKAWPTAPENMVWISNFNKPLIMSEFGGEALYGSNAEPKDAASSWSEEYQEQIFKDQIKMLKMIPFLRGTCPWILVDFRAPGRLHPVFQQGWNRKGLISDRGDKKKSWFVMKAFYDTFKP
jgi:beta-glucuronidase